MRAIGCNLQLVLVLAVHWWPAPVSVGGLSSVRPAGFNPSYYFQPPRLHVLAFHVSLTICSIFHRFLGNGRVSFLKVGASMGSPVSCGRFALFIALDLRLRPCQLHCSGFMHHRNVNFSFSDWPSPLEYMCLVRACSHVINLDIFKLVLST